MGELDGRFFRLGAPAEVRLIGAYLRPPVSFAEFEDHDFSAGHMAEVVASFRIDQFDMLVTRTGGICHRPPDEFPTIAAEGDRVDWEMWKRKAAYAADFAERVNLLICELSLIGLVPCAPVSPFSIRPGERWGDQAVIQDGGDMALSLLRGDAGIRTMLHRYPPGVLDGIEALTRARALQAVGPTLPEFVAAAYAAYASGQAAETVINAWIVVEQFVDEWWQRWVRSTPEGDHRNALAGDQLVNRRLNMLQAVGEVDDELADSLRTGAAHRNGLVHRGVVSISAAGEVMEAMFRSMRVGLNVEFETASYRPSNAGW